MAYFRTHLKQRILEKSATVGESLTQRDIAEATGLSLPTISRWYKGRVDRVESGTIKKLSEYFDCTFSDLVEYVPDERP